MGNELTPTQVEHILLLFTYMDNTASIIGWRAIAIKLICQQGEEGEVGCLPCGLYAEKQYGV